jgi:hypothetical protein
MRLFAAFVLLGLSLSSLAKDTNLDALTGTLEVEFQPSQSAGIKHGCTLVYRTIGRDYAYKQGSLVMLVGNIGIRTNDDRSNLFLTLKIGIYDNLQQGLIKPVAPFFAYIQTPSGTTAKGKFVQFDSDTPGYRNFAYRLDAETMKVYADIAEGTPVKIGFNRKKDGLDVLVPLDLAVANTNVSETGVKRNESNQMLLDFFSCSDDVINQVRQSIEKREQFK